MIAYDLDILVRDYTQDDLYNLFNKTYVEFTLPNTSEYIVQQDEEMRIDLICYRIYDSTEYVAFLLNFNGIENPLNVMPGDLIKYVDIYLDIVWKPCKESSDIMYFICIVF
jgi:hypothetical protein